MARALPCFSVLALLAGCSGGSTTLSGDTALELYGSPSCVRADLPADSFPDALTVELWVNGQADGTDQALVAWVGGFSLYADDDGDGVFADGSDSAAASSGNGWMDGATHHVAGTWDGETAHLYIDGAFQGFGPAALGESPSGQLTVGCWGNQGRHLVGIIDELRLSSTVRYDDDFEPPSAAFEVDEDTWQLWHFDEGEGTQTSEEVSGKAASLEGVDWTYLSRASG